MKKTELLAPAGNMEKLKTAFFYGADAVYLGGPFWGLRAQAGNFSHNELEEAVKYAHERDKKIYVTVNIYANDHDFDGLDKYLQYLYDINVDAVIISDLGVMTYAKEKAPNLPIHISTQANIINSYAATTYHKLGAERVILGRELSLEEIANMKKKNPELELEIFVHGAMCIAYSGRCLLSAYMTGRSGNKGDCTHPCRWKYYITEEHRKDDHFEMLEDKYGTYIMSSKDLNLIKYIPEIIESGVSSLKIEGRMKGINYLASVVKTYRQAIDSYYENKEKYILKDEWIEELEKVSDRGYTEAFFKLKDTQASVNYENKKMVRNYVIVGQIKELKEKNFAVVEVRNKLTDGEEIEFMLPAMYENKTLFAVMHNLDKESIEVANPNSIIYLNVPNGCQNGTIIRKKISD